MDAIGAIVALLAGIAAGWWLRSAAQKGERTQMEVRQQQLTAELAEARARVEKIQDELAAAAGFERLAEERGRALEQNNVEIAALRAQMQALQAEQARLASESAALQSQLKSEQEKAAEVRSYQEQLQQKMAQQFEVVAGEILEKKTRNFSADSQERLGALLTPLREQIEGFRKKVEEAQSDHLVGRTELSVELKKLRDLNDRLSNEAHSLSTALRQDTQKQGHWGEIILLDILENSGLRKDEHYTYQESFAVEEEEGGQERRRQTDVIIRLPEGRHLIVDSKVTLSAYRDYAKTEDEKEREDALKRLMRSIRDHYTGLAARNYQRIPGLQSPDFVVLFTPLEPAFLLAMQKDETLWTDAYQKGVLIAGPTTILFVVRIVENLWRQELQAKNVQKVMERGEKLYDKFRGFVDDLQAVGNKIGEADQKYKEAFSKLSTGRENLVRQVELLRELGLKPKKRIKRDLLELAGVEEGTEETEVGGEALLSLAADAESSEETEF